MKRKTIDSNFGISKRASGFIEGATLTVKGATEPVMVHVNPEEAYELYTNNDWLGAVIDRIVDDCAMVDHMVVPKDPNAEVTGKLKSRIDFVNDFLSNPNPNKEPFKEIRKKMIRDALVVGRGAMEKVNDNGKLKELYSLSTKRLKVRTDEHGNLYKRKTYKQEATNAIGRTINTKTKEQFWNIDEVIFMVPRPVAHTPYGINPLDTVATSVSTDLLRATHNSTNFLNGSEASGILSAPGLSRSELRKFRQYWEDRHKGASRAHTMAIMNTKDVKFERMSETNRDMEFNNYGKELRNKIFSVYKMQPFILGIVDETTSRLDPSGQVKVYKMGAIKPMLVMESYHYTMEICEDGFGFNDVMIIFPAIDREDAKEEAEIDGVDIKNGVIVVNERRAKLGKPPVAWGDTPFQLAPGGGQVDPNTGQLIPPHEQPNNGPNPKPAEGKKPAKKPEKKPEPSAKDIMDEFMKTYANVFVKDKKNAEKVFSVKKVKRLFKDKDERKFASTFIASIKLLSNIFDGSSGEFRKKIDRVIKDMQFDQDYYKLYLD